MFDKWEISRGTYEQHLERLMGLLVGGFVVWNLLCSAWACLISITVGAISIMEMEILWEEADAL